MAKPLQKRPSESLPLTSSKRSTLTAAGFLKVCETYAETGAAIHSCEIHGFTHSQVREAIRDQAKRGDDSWVEHWAEAYDKFKESLHKAIVERGRNGTPVKWRIDPTNGERTAVEWEYSDRMLELAAKGHMPEVYRDRLHVSGTVGLEPTIDAFANLSIGAKREIRAIIVRDLEQQREAARAAELKGQVIDVAPVSKQLEDLSAGGEDHE